MSVWIAVINVKQFEDFMNQFYAALKEAGKKDPIVAQMARQTRYLTPAGPNPDGTYSYVFLMDPLVPTADYRLEALLKKVLPPADADRLFKQFMDSVVAEKGTAVELVQTNR